jgi:ribosomal protein S18 acetylase RimI-like enzyme
MIDHSAFDSRVLAMRVGWARATPTPNELSGYDLVFLRGPWPCGIDPRATFVDVRYDMAASASGRNVPMIRGRAADVARAAAFAVCGGQSRYVQDARLAPFAEVIMRRWIAGSCGRGEFLADHRSDICGFACVAESAESLRLDQIAVDPAARRRGVGRALVDGFLALPGPRDRRVRVGAGNVPAINMYLAAGFKIAAVESVQHLWLTEY